MTVSQATRRSTYNLEAARAIVKKSDSAPDTAKRLSMLELAHDLYIKEAEAGQLWLQAINIYKGRYTEESYLPTAAELTHLLDDIKAEKESLEARIIDLHSAANTSGNVKQEAQPPKPYQP